MMLLLVVSMVVQVALLCPGKPHFPHVYFKEAPRYLALLHKHFVLGRPCFLVVGFGFYEKFQPADCIRELQNNHNVRWQQKDDP